MSAPIAAQVSLSSVGKASWRALVASWFGWMFDGYEAYALVLVMGTAVHQLLPLNRLPKTSLYIGGLLAATMLGWAAGGVAAGIFADYFGRRRTLMISIFCYAIFSGLAAISWNYWSLLVFRFLTGLGLGAEWGPGAAIVAEFWPPKSRGRAGGVLHAAYGVGFLGASGIWLLLNPPWAIIMALHVSYRDHSCVLVAVPSPLGSRAIVVGCVKPRKARGEATVRLRQQFYRGQEGR